MTSSFDLAVAKRLLERRFFPVLSAVTLHYDRPLVAAGTAMGECWAPPHLDGEVRFEVRLDPALCGGDAASADGALIHELVHAAQIERNGVVGGSGSWHAREWARARDWTTYITEFFRAFPEEREAQVVALRLSGSPWLRELYAEPLHRSRAS